jgi:DNA polymerase-1
VIVDGMALVYRAHYALNGTRRDERGRDRGAMSMLPGHLREVGKHFGCVPELAWDSGRCFRYELFPEYKAGRVRPQAVTEQLPLIFDALNRAGLRSWRSPGFEADDVMATLALDAWPDPVVLVTPDKDLLQVVTERTVCAWWSMGKLAIKDTEYVQRKYGVAPRDIPMLLALSGDACDGLPGVLGVGHKKAARMIVAGTVPDDQNVERALALVRLRDDVVLELEGGPR